MSDYDRHRHLREKAAERVGGMIAGWPEVSVKQYELKALLMERDTLTRERDELRKSLRDLVENDKWSHETDEAPECTDECLECGASWPCPHERARKLLGEEA